MNTKHLRVGHLDFTENPGQVYKVALNDGYILGYLVPSRGKDNNWYLESHTEGFGLEDLDIIRQALASLQEKGELV